MKFSVRIDDFDFKDVESFLYFVCPMIRDWLDGAEIYPAASEVDDIGRDMWLDLSGGARFSADEFDDYLSEYLSEYADSYFADYDESEPGVSSPNLGADVTMTLTYNGKLLGQWVSIEDVESPKLLAMMKTDPSIATSIINYLESIGDDEINAHIDTYETDGDIYPLYDDFVGDLAVQLDCCQSGLTDNYNVDFDGFSIRTVEED